MSDKQHVASVEEHQCTSSEFDRYINIKNTHMRTVLKHRCSLTIDNCRVLKSNTNSKLDSIYNGQL